MDLLAQEYSKIMDVISGYDAHLMSIKGRSITVGMAFLSYAFQQKNKSIFLLCCVSPICFALVDAKIKQYQASYYPRMQAIEGCINQKEMSCPVLQGDRPWSDSKYKSGDIQQLGKAGVVMQHFILFVLAVILYFIPKAIERDPQLKSQSRGTTIASSD